MHRSSSMLQYGHGKAKYLRHTDDEHRPSVQFVPILRVRCRAAVAEGRLAGAHALCGNLPWRPRPYRKLDRRLA
jgi:hypothetical protein